MPFGHEPYTKRSKRNKAFLKRFNEKTNPTNEKD